MELDYMPISNGKKNQKIKSQEKIGKVTHRSKPKKDILKTWKKIAFIATMALAIKGTKDIASEINKATESEKSIEQVRDDVRLILNSNSDNLLSSDKTKYIHQYDHAGIAEDISEIGKEKGKIYEEALIAVMMESIEETGYKNMDRVIDQLDGDAKNKEDYIHLQGYETEKEYLEATRRKYVEAQKESAVREKYFEEDQKESRGR